MTHEDPAGGRLSDLDDLFADNLAVAATKTKPLIRQPSKKELDLESAEERRKKEYTDPTHWIPGRGIALIHKESNSLIGNYREYVHYRIPSCRKLLLVKEPILIDANEYREGSWWMDPVARDRITVTQWDTTRNEVVPLLLDRMGVFCPAAPISIYMRFGGITRVELTEACDFASADGSELLHLTKGVNVYEAMQMEGKIALRKELML